MPVWASAAPSIYQAVELPVLADLLVWHPSTPTHWWYRIGAPGAVLGLENLELAHAQDLPISFAMTPLVWLQGDCRGAVLLDVCEAHFRGLHEAENDAQVVVDWGGPAA